MKEISLSYWALFIAAIPSVLVIGVLLKWQQETKTALYALSRMLLQLLVVGFFLTYIFHSNSYYVVIAVLGIMVLISSWIALRTVETKRKSLYGIAVLASLIGGGSTLILITQVSLEIKPWFDAQIMIPLAGMIFASAMNSISIAAERLQAELERAFVFTQARNIALKASLIPVVNSLFAVGLVSLPGMMTGQILSGVDPFIAARYQILVMFMLFGATGLASAVYLQLYYRMFIKNNS